ncbi:MAG: glutamate--tRNA ligase family protein [bacterium]|nr:glutamate--tRNA ligase family protein [bacterium]
MKSDLVEKISKLMAADAQLLSRAEIESKYPSRELAEGAEVTRFCPSPTGFVHIGSVYTALICQFLARQTAGRYILRIEDTDKKREVAGAKALIATQLSSFSLSPDEGLQPNGQEQGNYGPYLQSERQEIYLAFALELLKSGRAYPCFATSEELAEAVKDQQSKKLRPGYYGEWALWRDRTDEDVIAAIDAGKPFVLRFKSLGDHSNRVEFMDVLKGSMSLPENDLDVPLIKSDESRLPTYHLAHVVDDYLMKATIILRGEEWLPSTPLHLELSDALNIPRFRYAHLGLISIIDASGGGKRKLSKRKDAEADVDFWLKAGYPIRAIKAYLLGLANSNFEDWYRENPEAPLEDFEMSLHKLAASRSPLLDMKKVEDYSKDEIARLPQHDFETAIMQASGDSLRTALEQDISYTQAVLAIERTGDNKRKDLAKFSDAFEQYGYFYNDVFAESFAPRIQEELSDFKPEVVASACSKFLKIYSPEDNQQAWFDKLKQAAEASGFALDNKEFKANSDKYNGNVADFARIIRVKLTGKNRTPDLHAIMQIMGAERVTSRLA